VARTIDSDRKHLTETLRAAVNHRGTSLIEIYQNCNIFNDGAFDPLKDNATRDDVTIRLVHGQPIRFGVDGSRGVVRADDGSLQVVDVAEVSEDSLVVHDAHAEDPSVAFALSRLSDPMTLANTPIGVFRDVDRPSYDELAVAQVARAKEAAGGTADLAALIAGGDTWQVD
jgi:2-oxoglutarate ferredoxin oxidoreductase subunit beta